MLFLFNALIRTGVFQVRPAYSIIPADVPQDLNVTKSKGKMSKVKTKSKEIGSPTTLAPKNDEDPNDSEPVDLKVR